MSRAKSPPLPPAAPPRVPRKRAFPHDRRIGYTPDEWARRCAVLPAVGPMPVWYTGHMSLPRDAAARLCLVTSAQLAPLWDATVGRHLAVLERHFVALNKARKEAGGTMARDAQVPPPLDLNPMDLPEIPLPEVARGWTSEPEYSDGFPWTHMGEVRVEWPDQMNDSISSANTSIVQHAARWISPDSSHDLVERKRPRMSRMASPRMSLSPLAALTPSQPCEGFDRAPRRDSST